ncbi:hypothetical protein EYF80_003562 [Liparis tanakae]|uniref:Uncharacterized protein n=1 Tax=Liparis tanakae TaxID=230148 RepID=A0A4Z2J702_9TELE|nr:hypothetical protein EYF80_003562 [Liparis tanakae]
MRHLVCGGRTEALKEVAHEEPGGTRGAGRHTRSRAAHEEPGGAVSTHSDTGRERACDCSRGFAR